MSWVEKHFDERQISEIDFCRMYAYQYAHGTDGHNAKLIIAKLSSLLYQIHSIVNSSSPDIDEIRTILGVKNEL